MKSKHIILMAAVALALAACKGKDEVKPTETPAVADTTQLLRIEAADTDSVTLHRDSASVRLALDGAITAGDLRQGDTLALTTDSTGTRVLRAVNVSQLKGFWTVDPQASVGMRLSNGGTVECVNPTELTFNGWFVINGKFVLSYVLTDNEEDPTQKAAVTDIVSLTDDSLKLDMEGRKINLMRCQALLIKQPRRR